MHLTLERDLLLKSLSHAYGIVEKKSTLPILSNILIEAKEQKVRITATDLDIIYSEEIPAISVTEEGSTTTSASIFYDILRKLTANSKIEFTLVDKKKIKLESGNSRFNLPCMSPEDFPLSNEDFTTKSFKIQPQKLLKLLNKTKISISGDETRHYLNGIFLHKTKLKNTTYLTGVSTDSHRLSSSSCEIEPNTEFEPIILPKKTIFQLLSLLDETSNEVKISNNKSKIKFEMQNSVLISKVIDGKFPDYSKVIPLNNDKKLQINLNDFKNSIERVITVSSDRKEGLKITLSKGNICLSINNPNSGEGIENIKAEFNSDDMNIIFNSSYLLDITSQIENEMILINLKDPGSPVMIKDLSDGNSFYVVMPMKI